MIFFNQPWYTMSELTNIDDMRYHDRRNLGRPVAYGVRRRRAVCVGLPATLILRNQTELISTYLASLMEEIRVTQEFGVSPDQ